MLALLIMLLLAAAGIKLVVAICGHTITWRLAVVMAAALAVLVAYLVW